MTLEQVEHGVRYRIASIDCRDPAIQRLMVLGLVEGVEVALTSTAIGGDPMEFELFGNAISLRRDQAQRFNVVALDNERLPAENGH